MGKHYYLSRGYNTNNYKKCRLSKIFDDIKSIEAIDMFTSQFDNLEQLKIRLYNQGLITSPNEEIVIACNKTNKVTKEKRLVPIFLRPLIFKEDLYSLGITGNSYKELAEKLWKYILNHQNDKHFMSCIMQNYYDKYSSSERKIKAPIYESGDIGLLINTLRMDNPSERIKREYEVCFANFFRNEIYKCEIKLREISFSPKAIENVKVFEPIDGSINEKGFHDLLIHIIEYSKLYEKDYEDIEEINKREESEPDIETEEFIEESDYDLLIKNYAVRDGVVKFDLSNPEEIAKNEYIQSILESKHNLTKKYDGME